MARYSITPDGKIFVSSILGANLRYKRHLKNLNQIEVTIETKIPLRQIRAFEQGRIIDFNHFVRYANFLNFDINIEVTAQGEEELLTEAQSLII